MALKFRRGSTQQQSGSLVFGEPFVNTTLNTLLIGGQSGDIQLVTTIQTASFATTGSNIFIGNQTVSASINVSGSIIVNGNISANSISGSINYNNLTNIPAGIVSGSSQVFSNVSGDITIASNGVATIAANSVALGTDTTGNYMSDLTQGTGVTITHTPGEGSNATIAIGQAVATTSNVTFGNVTATGTISGSAFTGVGNLTTYSSSVNSRLITVEAVSASAASALNSFSASNASTDTTQTTNISAASASAAAAFASASAYSASAAVVDAAQDVLIASLRTNVVSASVFTTFSTSVDSRLDSVELVSASSAASLNTVSGAFATTIGNLGSTYATDAELSAVSSAVAVRDASQDTTISTLSSSVNSRLVVVEAVSASAASALNSLSSSASSAYAKLGAANTFNGNQTISGSLIITQDLVIGGSASIQHITSSQLNIGDNIITVNTLNPSIRFGGLAVIDSGSAQSGSFLYDSVHDEFVFVHRGDGTNITSSHFLVGPETYNDLGNETYLTANKILKSKGTEHIVESNITDTGTAITLGSNTSVTGTLVATGTSLISASAQITLSSTTGYSTFSSSIATTNASQDTTISTLSSSVNSRLIAVEAVSASAASALNSFSASNAATDATQTTNISAASASAAAAFASASAYSASAAVVDAAQDVLIASLRNNIVSASVFTTFSTSVDSRLDSVELVSASAAGALNSVSGSFATTIGNLGSTYATDAELSAVSSAVATRDAGQDTTISTLSSSVASRLGTLEGKDITITLTGDVTGTGTITDLGNVSFATTVAANSVALGTDTTGNYMTNVSAGNTGIVISHTESEGSTATISLVNGVVSGSSQVSYTGLSNIPANIVSGSTQISSLGFATTASNTFTGNQNISGSVTSNIFMQPNTLSTVTIPTEYNALLISPISITGLITIETNSNLVII